MLFNCVVIIAKKQTAYCNPFRPVETRSDLLKPVETRFNPFRLTRLNLSKHVQTCWNTLQSVQTRFPSSIPPPPSPPFSPLLPLFPFLWGGGGRGREGGGGRGGNTITKNPPEGGGGGRSPPPPPDFNNNKKLSKFSHSFFSLLCNLPLLPPRGFSLSPLLLLLLKTT